MLTNICTLANQRAYDELLVMLKSLAQFMELDVYLGADAYVIERLQHEKIGLRIHTYELLKSGLHAKIGNDDFMQIMRRKADILEIAVREQGHSLFVDADMLFFGPIWGVDLKNHEVVLSPHYILDADEEKFGKFNAGYLGTSAVRFPEWWRNAMTTSRFVDQECLVYAPQEFTVQELTIHHNFGWWRLNQCDPKRKWWRIDLPNRPVRAQRLKNFQVAHDRILYDDKPLVSFHTHIKDRHKRSYQSANRLAVDLLSRSKDRRHQEILSWL